MSHLFLKQTMATQELVVTCFIFLTAGHT